MRYPVHTLTSSRPSSTSSFVSATLSRPLIRAAYRATTTSYQPQRRGRPVTEPNSLPLSRKRSPLAPSSSVGIGPSPTRVAYAFTTPSTPLIILGLTPRPVHTPPIVELDEVTNGYVP